MMQSPNLKIKGKDKAAYTIRRIKIGMRSIVKMTNSRRQA
jgi:hypothetical protein